MKQKLDFLQFEDGSHVFFTSDTHFGHENIIRFCNRPFASAEEMNEVLINNWNSVVGPDDHVFHLGDFALGGAESWKAILPRLNGHIHLILGNHDLKNFRTSYADYFEEVVMQKYIQVGKKSIYLNHCPFLCFGGAYRDEPVWQLFGHVHSGPTSEGKDTERLQYLFPTQYDVGVDNNNYTPVSFEQVKEIINKQREEYEKYLRNSNN